MRDRIRVGCLVLLALGVLGSVGCPPPRTPTTPGQDTNDASDTRDAQDVEPRDVGDARDADEAGPTDADGTDLGDAVDVGDATDGREVDVPPDTEGDTVGDAGDTSDASDADTGPPDCPEHLSADAVDEEVCNPIVVDCKYQGEHQSAVGDNGCCRDYLTPCRVGEKDDELWECGANVCNE